MSTEIISDRDLTFKKNTRIIHIAKVGDKVGTNDPLVIFEEVGDDEKEALASLDKLDKKNSKSLQDLARNVAKAKYAGEIVDMRILYNIELEELHPTLRKVVNDYISVNKDKAKLLTDIRKDQIVEQPTTEKIDSDKIYGTEMQGVMLIFYIKHVDECKVGDKITFFTSAKTILAQVLDEGQEPHSEYRNTEIEAVISPMSLISRMIPDIYLLGYTNKVILELKKQCIEDLGI